MINFAVISSVNFFIACMRYRRGRPKGRTAVNPVL